MSSNAPLGPLPRGREGGREGGEYGTLAGKRRGLKEKEV